MHKISKKRLGNWDVGKQVVVKAQSCIEISSVARGWLQSPLHCSAYQNAEYEKYHVFSTSETVFCFGIDSKSDLKYIFKCLFWGGLIS